MPNLAKARYDLSDLPAGLQLFVLAHVLIPKPVIIFVRHALLKEAAVLHPAGLQIKGCDNAKIG
jgi:hypothetical protein